MIAVNSAHPSSNPTALGGSAFLPFSSIKNKRPMGFEDIHQPKLNDVFCFRVNPWLILLLSCPSVAHTSGSDNFFTSMLKAIQVLEP